MSSTEGLFALAVLAGDPALCRVKGCAGELDDLTPAEVEATYYVRQSQPDGGMRDQPDEHT